MTNQITLKVTEGALQGMTFSFGERTVCIVGRAPDCNIRLPDDKDHETISRYHCLLDINPPDIRVRDFGSKNGTYVNDKKIGQREKGQAADEARNENFPEYDLKQGDEIKLGKTVFQVSIEGPDSEVTRMPAALGGEPSFDLASLDAQVSSNAGAAGIEGYNIIREIGRGGMGAVYLARHEDTGEEVALKIMLPHVAVDEHSKQMFFREIKNTEALQHENLVRLLNTGYHDGAFYFTLEYCNHGSLHEMIKETDSGTLPAETVVPLILQALDGLAFAHNVKISHHDAENGDTTHASGLVHRDIKPANIYLTQHNDRLIAKIGDFGLAKAFDNAGLSGQTATGSVAGTPLYMPRQQILNFKYSKPEVDVWAMAATLYKALVGKSPRDFPRGKDPWLSALKNAPVPILQRNPAIPKPLADVIDKALIDNPEITFKTAAQFKQALMDAL